MIFLEEEGPKIQKISLSSLLCLEKNLGEFISLYDKKLYFANDPNAVESMIKLRRIYHILQRKEYHLLMSNPEMIIDFNDYNNEDLK